MQNGRNFFIIIFLGESYSIKMTKKVFIFCNSSFGHSSEKSNERDDRISSAINSLLNSEYEELFYKRKLGNSLQAIRLIEDVHGENYLSDLDFRFRIKECSVCNLRHCKVICPDCSSTNFIKNITDDTYITNNTCEDVIESTRNIIRACEELVIRPYSYLLIRPPGHHCFKTPQGFCIINNAIIGAKYLLRLGYQRVLILDWDYHHFNGTEQFLNSSIVGVSIHAFGNNIYPGTGSAESSTENCLNIPLILDKKRNKLFYSNKRVMKIFIEQVLPFIQSKNPDVIIVSNGLDMHKKDTFVGLGLSDKFYCEATNKLKEFRIPLMFILEGGYNSKVISSVSQKLICILNG